jgi:hypothetical protein
MAGKEADMGRLQLFELEDQSWFPATFREAMTDFLSFVENLSDKPFRKFTTKLREAMQSTNDTTIVDLCSGGTGPIISISRLMKEQEQYPVRTIVTDLYPNVKRFEYVQQRTGLEMELRTQPVDVRAVPKELNGFRLICNAFHHFKPEDARTILADAIAARRGIALMEIVDRSPPAIFSTLISPITFWAVTPFIRPFRWSRLFFTYVLPIVPLASIWDGVVSCLRVYSPEEMKQLVESIGSNDYEWDIGRIGVKNAPAKLTYLIGRPKSA